MSPGGIMGLMTERCLKFRLSLAGCNLPSATTVTQAVSYFLVGCTRRGGGTAVLGLTAKAEPGHRQDVTRRCPGFHFLSRGTFLWPHQ